MFSDVSSYLRSYKFTDLEITEQGIDIALKVCMHKASLLGHSQDLFIEIQIRSTQRVKSKIWAQVRVDGRIVHNLPSIMKGQSLAWDGPLYWLAIHLHSIDIYSDCIGSDTGSESFLSFQIYEESLFGHKHTMRCNIEFSTSDISRELPVSSIGKYATLRYLSANCFDVELQNVPTMHYRSRSRSETRHQS